MGKEISQRKKHPLYNTWVLMRQRCNNPSNFAYEHYGGRGIKICERWGDFEKFVDDMGERPSPKHSIDRIDNNKGYSPENCQWSTVEEQRLNRRCFKTSESGQVGVREIKPGVFQAIVHFSKVRYYIGKFDSIQKAVAARASFVREKTSAASN